MFDCGIVEDDSQGKNDQAHYDGFYCGVFGFFLDEELYLINRVWVEISKALHYVLIDE